MPEIEWEMVYETNGMLMAEILRGVLEAQEIAVTLSQEGIGRVYGLTVGTLGRVQILVPSSEVERARQILEEYESNNLAGQADIDAEISEQTETDEEDQPEENEID